MSTNDIMAEPLTRIQYRIKRIGELTKQGLSSGVIAERLGMRTGSVYLAQIRHGYRKVEHPKLRREIALDACCTKDEALDNPKKGVNKNERV